ncbi:hypothetical protein [Methylobacterium sp. Leaf87]|uniref:hypothetical protein n=1 Tax=Methylobacterium sp. Leaf87 TaxID=1736243 RepID=UPI000AD6912A|nr:hypothetical protein [Methylobacterium sp. Leaf87]
MSDHPCPIRTFLIVAIATLIGAGALWLHFTKPRLSAGLTPGVLPVCDSPFTRKLLKQTIEQASAARATGLEVLRLGFMRHHLDGVRDTTQLPARVCEAEVFANAGRQTLGFSLEWTSAEKDEVWLSVPQLPW